MPVADELDNEVDLATWCIVDAFQRRPAKEKLSIFFARLSEIMECFDISEVFTQLLACTLYAGTRLPGVKEW